MLCPVCLPLLPALSGVCFSCHQSVKLAASCQDCLHEIGLDRLYVVSSYEGVAKSLVTTLKFNGNQSAARIMAESMCSFLAPLSKNIHLTYMPATTQHVRQRGYDQSELLARHLSRRLGVPKLSTLRRQGQTHQLGASRDQRLEQLSSALSVRNHKLIEGKYIILIDDVLTTGSSLRAATSVLRAAGAARVDGLVFAQAYK